MSKTEAESKGLGTDGKCAKDTLVEALEGDGDESIIGMTNHPVLPLVGSENVPISAEEEKDVE